MQTYIKLFKISREKRVKGDSPQLHVLRVTIKKSTSPFFLLS